MRTTYSKVSKVPSGSATDSLRPREKVLHSLLGFLKPHIAHRDTTSSYTGKTPAKPKRQTPVRIAPLWLLLLCLEEYFKCYLLPADTVYTWQPI